MRYGLHTKEDDARMRRGGGDGCVGMYEGFGSVDVTTVNGMMSKRWQDDV